MSETGNTASSTGNPVPALTGALKWFRIFTWIGVLVNLVGFVLPALFTPDLMETLLGPGMVELSYVWVAFASMLLMLATLFYIPAAKDPLRYHVYAWLSVVGRGIAAAFWIWQDFRWELPGAIEIFFLTDLIFCIVFLVILAKGMPPEYKISAENLTRAVSSWHWTPPSNSGAALFRGLVWASVGVNLVLAAAFLFAPAWVAEQVGTAATVTPTYLWIGNCGMLLIQLSLFALPAGHNPLKYHVYAWIVAASQSLLAAFWVWQKAQWTLGGPLGWAWLPHLAFFVLMVIALQRALPAEYRASVGNLFTWLGGLWTDVMGLVPSTLAKVTTAVVLVALTAVGYILWDNLARAEPDTVFAEPADQYKYGAIGLGQAYRVPTYLWNVMPQICPELLPGVDVSDARNGWKSLGLIYEEDKEYPVGLSQRHIGYPSVEPNCGLCHTASYRTAENEPEQLILGGSAHGLDLQSFQWFLYDCAASDNFTVKKVMAAIEADLETRDESLSSIEKMIYEAAILPFAKTGLAVQRKAYEWQKSRPPQGRGRTDTFNPTKLVVFHMPDDGTIGTVDLPVVWNQRTREGMYLHWDGNNNDIHERNYAAAMAVGASPYSVLEDNFNRVTNFLLKLAPPKYPYPVDEAAAERGWAVFKQECADCHEMGGPKVGTVTALDEIGTDRHRLDSFTESLVEDFHSIQEGPFKFNAYRKTDGYSNLPIDGLWARAPYLHNGSVPTLLDLLSPASERTKTFERGSDIYDPDTMGFVSGPPTVGPGFTQDVSVAGNGNQGHEYGVDRSDEDKRDLIEYLKTL